MLKDFKKFILRGNVVDLAVAVVVGAAFNAVVQGLVKDFITPLIQGVTGSDKEQAVQGILHLDIFGLHFVFNWGDFVSAVLSFLIIAAVIFFLVVQPINKLQSRTKRNKTTEDPSDKKCQYCLSTIPIKATKCAFCTSKLPA